MLKIGPRRSKLQTSQSTKPQSISARTKAPHNPSKRRIKTKSFSPTHITTSPHIFTSLKLKPLLSSTNGSVVQSTISQSSSEFSSYIPFPTFSRPITTKSTTFSPTTSSSTQICQPSQYQTSTHFSTLLKKLPNSISSPSLHSNNHVKLLPHKQPPQIKSKRAFRHSKPSRRSAAPKLSPNLDREALSRGEHVEILSFTQTLKKLTPYLWPKDDTATKVRVVSALSCLFFSKILNVGVPVLFKEAIDGLTTKIPSLQTAKTRQKQTQSETTSSTSDSVAALDDADIVNTIANEPVANEPDTKATEKLIDSFLDFLQSPEFLEISTTQLPFAVLSAWGIVRILSSFTNELKNALFTKISNTATKSIAVDLLKHLLNMDMAFHFDRNTGSISRAIDRGNKSIGMALSMITFRIIPTIFEMGLVIGVLATQCGTEFSSVALATLFAYVTFTVAITQWRTKFKQDMNRASNQASAVAFDALINVDTVQKFNNQKLEADKFSDSWDKYGTAQVKNESSLAFLNWGQSAIFSVGLTSVMLLAAQGVQNGTLSVGDLVMVNALLLQLSLPLNIVGTVYRELKQAVLDMQTMFAIRQTKSQIFNVENPVDFDERARKLIPNPYNTLVLQPSPAAAAISVDSPDLIQPINPLNKIVSTHVEEKSGRLPPPTGGFSLELKNIAFHYPSDDEKHIIEDISVTIPAGKSVGFCGGSGSGKSTILKLASRQFDVSRGEVLIDGVPIKNIELSSLRNTIGIVPQETVLFNESIMYNIRYAKPTATDEEVINSAKLAQIHDSIVQMKDGYNSLVGERGLKISGGEKQRIAIARLMLLNPPIVFCDEATSALDSATEYEIMANLRNITQNKTCLYIAHRLSTITHCSEIIVIDKGKVAERGSHQELLHIPNGLYHTMWKLQSTVGHQMVSKNTTPQIESTGAPVDVKM